MFPLFLSTLFDLLGLDLCYAFFFSLFDTPRIEEEFSYISVSCLYLLVSPEPDGMSMAWKYPMLLCLLVLLLGCCFWRIVIDG